MTFINFGERLFFLLIFVVLSSLVLLNIYYVTSPNDGISYYSIAINILENLSLSHGEFADIEIYTTQIGISLILAIFIFFFDFFWFVPFYLFIFLIWFYSLRYFSYVLSLTILNKYSIFGNRTSIFFYFIFLLLSSFMLIRIVTSFYNEAVYFPIQIYLFSRFLLFSHDKETIKTSDLMILMFSLVAVVFRFQHLIFLASIFIVLLFLKKISFRTFLIYCLLNFAYLYLIIYLANHLTFDTSAGIESFFLEIDDRFLLSLRSFSIVFSLYLLPANIFIIYLLASLFLLIAYIYGSYEIWRNKKSDLIFLYLVIFGNLLFTLIFLPLNFFDDFARYYWFHLIPLALLLVPLTDKLIKFRFRRVILISFLSLFLLGAVYSFDDIKERITNKIIAQNTQKNLIDLNDKWNLKTVDIYTDSFMRHLYWITKKPIHNIENFDPILCSSDKNIFLISNMNFEKYQKIDNEGRFNLYDLCKKSR